MPVQRETTSAISSSVTFCAALVFRSAVFPLCRLRSSRDAPVLAARHFADRHGGARALQLVARRCSLFFLDLGGRPDSRLLGLPDSSRSANCAQLADLVFSRPGALLAASVSLLQRLALDLELIRRRSGSISSGLESISMRMRAGGLVDQVDGLVRQLAVGDVAVRQRGRGDDGRVGDLDPWCLVRSFRPRRMAMVSSTVGSPTKHLLETPFQRGVLLDVLAVFVERGGADACSSPRASAGLSMLPASIAFLGLRRRRRPWCGSRR